MKIIYQLTLILYFFVLIKSETQEIIIKFENVKISTDSDNFMESHWIGKPNPPTFMNTVHSCVPTSTLIIQKIGFILPLKSFITNIELSFDMNLKYKNIEVYLQESYIICDLHNKMKHSLEDNKIYINNTISKNDLLLSKEKNTKIKLEWTNNEIQSIHLNSESFGFGLSLHSLCNRQFIELNNVTVTVNYEQKKIRKDFSFVIEKELLNSTLISNEHVDNNLINITIIGWIIISCIALLTLIGVLKLQRRYKIKKILDKKLKIKDLESILLINPIEKKNIGIVNSIKEQKIELIKHKQGIYGEIYKAIINGNINCFVESYPSILVIGINSHFYSTVTNLKSNLHENIEQCFGLNSLGFGTKFNFYYAPFDITLEELFNTHQLNNFEKQWNLVNQLLNGISFLLENGFIHHNLQPSSIHININLNDYELKISDHLNITDRKINRKKVFRYDPPETFINNNSIIYDTNSMIWNLGVIIWQIYSNENKVYSFIEDNKIEKYRFEGNHLFFKPNSNLQESIKNMLEMTCKKEKKERINIIDLFKKNFILKSIN